MIKKLRNNSPSAEESLAFTLPKYNPDLCTPPAPSKDSKIIECYFSEIYDLAQNMDHSEALKDKPLTKPIQLLKQNKPNCYVQPLQQGLLVISKGGSNFHIPLEHKVERVFALSEGVLIQFVVKQDPKFSEILQYQRTKQFQSQVNLEQQQRFSYVTLNKHPLNPLKVLGVLRKEDVVPWINSQQKIVYVSNVIPLAISYNPLLQRNAFHILKTNIQETQREAQRVNFHNNFYTIKDFCDNAAMSYGFPPNMSFQIVTDMIFEENTREECLSQAILARGNGSAHFLLHALLEDSTSQGPRALVIYDIKLLDNCRVQLVHRSPEVVAIFGTHLFEPQVKVPKVQQLWNPRQQQDIQISIVLQAIKKLPEAVLIVEQNSYHICYNGRIVYSAAYSQQPYTIISARLLEQNILHLNASSKTIEVIIPKCITDPLVCAVLKLLEEVVDIASAAKILSDFLAERNIRESNQSEYQILEKYIIRLYETAKPSHNAVTVFNDLAVKYRFRKILHLLYQQSLLHMFCTYSSRIAQLLYNISLVDPTLPNANIYCDYYLRHGVKPSSTKLVPNASSSQPGEIDLPDLMEFLSSMFESRKKELELGFSDQKNKFPVVFKRTKFVLRLFELLVDGETGGRSYYPDKLTLKTLKQDLPSKDILSEMFPLLHQKVFYMKYYRRKIEGFQRLQRVRDIPNITDRQQKVFLYLIQKGVTLDKLHTYPACVSTPIYETLRSMRRQLPSQLYEVIPRLGFSLINRQDLYKNIKLYRRQSVRPPYHLQNTSLSSTIQTLIHSSTSEQYYLTSNTFEMNRLNNDVVFTEVSRLLASTTDMKIKPRQIDIPEDKWEADSQLIISKFANHRLAVLPGQGAFTLGTSQTYITEVIKINKINVSALMPNDTKIVLDLKEDKETMVFWPEFHNGVAAGLRLSRHIIPLSQDHLKTWIFYQKPETPKRDHSGFLLALGLLGYLQCFSPTDIYQYLKPNNQFTSAAILLGVSASNISKSEESLSKTLFLHIPSILPPSTDLQIPINVQTSAIIGMGLIHKGTSNRPMTEMTLSQIGRKPHSDKCLDREGYSLAAGWALGVICLGMAGKRESLRDLQLEERLIRFIEGGKIMDPPQSVISSNFHTESKCSSIRQGPNVNLHITAPSALMAISLMYLKSNNRSVAYKITIPNSFNTLQQCNPNLILMKTTAKNLIMWDSIGNTSQFIHAQVPELIKFVFQNSIHHVHQRYYLVYNVSEIDYHTITVVYTSVLTGAVVAMGMKYAGTGDKQAVATIKAHIEMLKNLKILKCELANDTQNKNLIDQYTLFVLLCSSLLSLSIVMAGTCDIECLRIAKIIRKRIQESKTYHYGFNMAVDMAIGFICLGYGNYSFNRNDMSIAALLLSIYPYFPNSPTDNKWHLQALRHFYVLAVEEKVFHAVDVDTNKVVSVGVQMKFESAGSLHKENLHTPVLLQQSKKLLGLKICDNDYFDVDFSFESIKNNVLPKVIYIKRKYAKDIDKRLAKSLNSTGSQHQLSLKLFNKEPKYLALAALDKPTQTSFPESAMSYIFGKSQNKSKIYAAITENDSNNNRSWTGDFNYDQMYYNFMKEDRLDLVETYLNLATRVSSFRTIRPGKFDNLLLLGSFYEISEIMGSLDSQNSQFFSSTRLAILNEQFYTLALKDYQTLRASSEFKQYMNGSGPVRLPDWGYRILKYLRFPNPYELSLVKKFFGKMSKDEGAKKSFMSTVQMYLYMSFPLCPVAILNDIADFYMNSV